MLYFIECMIKYAFLLITPNGRLELVLDKNELDGGVIFTTFSEAVLNFLILLIIIIVVNICYRHLCKKSNERPFRTFIGNSIRTAFEYFFKVLILIFVLNLIYSWISLLYLPGLICSAIWVGFYLNLFFSYKKMLSAESRLDVAEYEDARKYKKMVDNFNFRHAAFCKIPFDYIINEQNIEPKTFGFDFNFPEIKKIKLNIEEAEQYFGNLKQIKEKLRPVVKRLLSLIDDKNFIKDIEEELEWFKEDSNWESSLEDEYKLERLNKFLNTIFEKAMDWDFFIKSCYKYAEQQFVTKDDLVYYNNWKYQVDMTNIYCNHPIIEYYGHMQFPYKLLNGIFASYQYNFYYFSEFLYSCQEAYNSIISEFLKTRGQMLAGSTGEDILASAFDFYNDDEVKFYPNIRFEADGKSVENDGLVITENAIYSIESKHYSGNINITKDGKWTREKNGDYEILKVNNQSNNHIIISERVINSKLKELGIKDKINIIPIIVVTNENANIHNESDVVVVQPHMLPNIFRENKDKNYTKKMRDTIIRVIDENNQNLLSYDKIDLSASLEQLIDFILLQKNDIDTAEESLQILLSDKNFNKSVKTYYLKMMKQG